LILQRLEDQNKKRNAKMRKQLPTVTFKTEELTRPVDEEEEENDALS
jgi:hypothetical protein